MDQSYGLKRYAHSDQLEEYPKQWEPSYVTKVGSRTVVAGVAVLLSAMMTIKFFYLANSNPQRFLVTSVGSWHMLDHLSFIPTGVRMAFSYFMLKKINEGTQMIYDQVRSDDISEDVSQTYD